MVSPPNLCLCFLYNIIFEGNILEKVMSSQEKWLCFISSPTLTKLRKRLKIVTLLQVFGFFFRKLVDPFQLQKLIQIN